MLRRAQIKNEIAVVNDARPSQTRPQRKPHADALTRTGRFYAVTLIRKIKRTDINLGRGWPTAIDGVYPLLGAVTGIAIAVIGA